MARQHAHGVPDGPRQRQRRSRREDVADAVSAGMRHIDGGRVQQHVAGVDPAQHRLHGHLVGLQSGQLHDCGQGQLGAQQRSVGQPGAVHVGDLDLRPRCCGPPPVGGQLAGPAELGAVVGDTDGLAPRMRRRRVVVLDVVAHHAGSQHFGPQRLQGVAHHLHPSRGTPRSSRS
ncbi:phosphorylase domain protein [Mycobacterium kansasii]|uniref:Phosphorylase domain protein n=1 Tax=Mycobacterium kansasii TaxID=1768 RepID=A0A1V3XGT0_MYCKA|nr:phosphorylase domain protein [Mycobacterium kansasii]